jgi:hypothetical protein
MDHALVCCCGGDRTLCHNAIRDIFFWFASLAGVRAQKEKAGLLPVRPGDETLRGDRLFQSRRPADVWLPSGLSSKPCAVDFAVTSGLRSDILRRTCADPSFIWADYEELKRQHADTKAQCDAQGLDFAPFVIEAHGGGLGPVARRVCALVAKAAAAHFGDEVEGQAVDLVRCISSSLQRENARAVFRRLPSAVLIQPSANPDAWAEDGGTNTWQ